MRRDGGAGPYRFLAAPTIVTGAVQANLTPLLAAEVIDVGAPGTPSYRPPGG